MTAAHVSGWMLVEAEPGRRNRRPIDAAFLLLATIVLALTAVVASSAERDDEEVARALQTVLGWADSLWRLAFAGVLVLVIVVALGVLRQRRWLLARDLLVD